MAKIKSEPQRALLKIVKIPSGSKFAIEKDSEKDREYFKAIYLEIEEMIYNYQEGLCAKQKDKIVLVKESKTVYNSIPRINNIIANIWISYLDCYSIILTCEVMTEAGIITNHIRTLKMVSESTNNQIRIPKCIIKEFISDSHTGMK